MSPVSERRGLIPPLKSKARDFRRSLLQLGPDPIEIGQEPNVRVI